MADPYRFVPRRFGYGATPVAWQGWALTLASVTPLLVNSVWWRSRRRGGAGGRAGAGLRQNERAVAAAVLTGGNLLVAGPRQVRQEGKAFFSEEKKQKTFGTAVAEVSAACAQGNTS